MQYIYTTQLELLLKAKADPELKTEVINVVKSDQPLLTGVGRTLCNRLKPHLHD